MLPPAAGTPLPPTLCHHVGIFLKVPSSVNSDGCTAPNREEPVSYLLIYLFILVVLGFYYYY
jgi:hypothetical protein